MGHSLAVEQLLSVPEALGLILQHHNKTRVATHLNHGFPLY